RLYHQNPDGTFTDVTEKAGLTGMAQNYYPMGVAVGDYDNDGFEDIYVTGYGGNTLYHNNGDGTFTDVTKRAGVVAGGWSASAGFFDYDNDGNLDLFVTRYVDWSFRNNRYCGEQKPGLGAYCHPDNFKGVTNILFHNNGEGSFQDVTNPSGVGGSTLAFSGWSTHLFDYDNDGWKDLFVAQGHVMDTIEQTSPNMKYLEPPLLLKNESGHFVRVVPGAVFQKEWAGRGAAFGDIDNDGDVDIVVSNVGQRAYVLRNDGGNSRKWLGIQTIGRKSNHDGIGSRVRVVFATGMAYYFTV